MRVLKILLTAAIVVIALLGGVFVAAIIAVTALAIWLNNRFFRKPRSPLRGTPAPAGIPRATPPRASRTNRAPDPTAIEVTATEVPESRVPEPR